MGHQRRQVLVILVVEDEFFVRYDIADFLREAGHRVIESASGEHALMLCRSAAAIDMVFTDINLGGPANGFDVAERFRQERPDIPVLYLSGEPIDPARCVSGSLFVAKPFQQSDILSACRQLARR